MDATVSEDIPLLPSGFRVIPVDNNVVVSTSCPGDNRDRFIPVILYQDLVVHLPFHVILSSTVEKYDINLLKHFLSKEKLSWLQDGMSLNRTLDLASTLEGDHDVGLNGEPKSNTSSGQVRSVLTIAFQFAYEVHTRETCAVMARQYVRTVVASVQRVAMALAPSRGQPRQIPGNSDAMSLARHILSSYRY